MSLSDSNRGYLTIDETFVHSVENYSNISREIIELNMDNVLPNVKLISKRYQLQKNQN